MGNSPGRRGYLRALATLGAASLAGCQIDGVDDQPTVVGGPPKLGPFDEVVDAVDDLDCDPTGATACTAELNEALTSGRLLRLPSGTYQLDGQVSVDEDGKVGVFGEGDVRLVPPTGFAGELLHLDAPTALVENLDVEITAPETTAGVKVACDDRFHVENVTYHGRGTHPGASVPFAFDFRVRNASGAGVARKLTALRGSAIAHYKRAGGRGGIWIGSGNRGTIRIEDCWFEEFGNNGIYASRTAGNVQIVGGLYRNNNVANLRFGGDGSFARDVTVEVNVDAYEGPRTGMSEAFFTRGIVVEQGPETGIKEPGARIVGCDVDVRNSPSGGAGIAVWSNGRTLTVEDTKVRADVDGYPAIFRAPMTPLGDNDPSGLPRYLHLRNVEIVGGANDRAGVVVFDAPNTRIENCRIDQPGDGRAGVRLVRSSWSVIDGGSITAGSPVTLVPGEADVDECLVAFENDPELDGSGIRTADVRMTAADCLSPDDLSTLGAGQAVQVLEVEGGELRYVIQNEAERMGP